MSKKETPILFSTPMVQAILEGRKTMTRRIVKDKFLIQGRPKFSTRNSELSGVCPYGKIGDILWVRETWKCYDNFFIEFKASCKDRFEKGWKPSIHMPKKYARIWLEITNIRVEQLQDILEKDAIAEGIENMLQHLPDQSPVYINYSVTKKELEKDHWAHCANNSEHSFETLWKSINGEQSWNENPWVWVVEFKRILQP